MFVGTLLSTKSLILLVSKSNELPDDVISFKSSATEAKYLFSLLATASDSVMVYNNYGQLLFSCNTKAYDPDINKHYENMSIQIY